MMHPQANSARLQEVDTIDTDFIIPGGPFGKKKAEEFTRSETAVYLSAAMPVLSVEQRETIIATMAPFTFSTPLGERSLLRHSFEVAAGTAAILSGQSGNAAATHIKYLYDLLNRSAPDTITAAAVHDYGKTDRAIWRSIAHSGRLTPKGYTIMQTHPTRGAQILAADGVKNLAVLDMVNMHHALGNTPYPDAVVALTLMRHQNEGLLQHMLGALTISLADFVSAYKRNERSFNRNFLVDEHFIGTIQSSYHTLSLLSYTYAALLGIPQDEAREILKREFIDQFIHAAVLSAASCFKTYTKLM